MNTSRRTRLLTLGVVLWVALLETPLRANPSHGVATQGGAVMTTQGSQLKIQTSGNTFINWGSFNIAPGETTVFLQPSATSVVWNHINDPHPSQILGQLDANGYVILQNQSGFFVGGNAVLNAAGLIMTTTPSVPVDVSSSGAWDFSAPPPTAHIINYGQINAGPNGPVFLIARDIENHGSITAPGGNIGLYAGKEVLVSSRPDGRGLSATVKLPEGSVDNSGNLVADAGTIAINAQVVNQGGMIQANSVREQNGVIEVIASDSLTLAPTSIISAKGDNIGVSAGGNVTIKSGGSFSDQATSTINVSGGSSGGDGGQVEISARQMDSILSQMESQAAAGWLGGKLMIDPVNITLSAAGAAASSGTVNEGDSSGQSLTLNPNSFNSFSQILLQASQNITLSTAWILPDNSSASSLTLQAGGNITLSQGITAGQNWNVTLVAGADFVGATSVAPGKGTVSLTGSAVVQTENGNINVQAGNSVTVAAGAIRTEGGGSIVVNAESGNVNTGTDPNAYIFNGTSPLSGNLGGISTAAGGDVTISAGGNVTSLLVSGPSQTPHDPGSGAFGPEPGVVTVTAGGSVFGHFVATDSEVNGQIVASSITAETGNAGTAAQLLALSLVKGGWLVNAPNGSIGLQEVRNPNGVFNSSTANHNIPYTFNYDPNSFVDLEAGNGVALLGSGLPRVGVSAPTENAPIIVYPPSLTINAGAGGVTLGNNVTLFPSPDGNLTVNTSGGGGLEGAGFTLAMSDSGATHWVSAPSATDPTATTDFLFNNGHAATPVQLDNPDPVVFDISGNLSDVRIVTAKETHITVDGEMDNSSFQGQNLHASDTTFIDVTGRIFNPSAYSFVTLTGTGLALPPPLYSGAQPNYLQLLQNAVVTGSGPNSANAGALLPNLNLFYLSATHQLGYYGVMDATVEKLLTGTLLEKTFFADGKPVLDANGDYVTTTATFPAQAGAIAALYSASLGSANPSSPLLDGYVIGGPGNFNITAQSLDLGASAGIVSKGPANNHALAKIAKTGAAINITLQGDLDMIASQISSYYTGGSISIDSVAGTINAGIGVLPFEAANTPLGIWTAGLHSDVSVIAQESINVDGARIAAFDGGNVFVESTQGNVDAGTGDSAQINLETVVVNPRTDAVATPPEFISGSGILATTFQDAPLSLAVGNITVLAPKGDISASAGGVSQEPQNGNTSLRPTLTLIAGTRDADGVVIFPGSINASGSGVIGINTTLNAAGNISGLIIAQGNSSINAAANVSGTFFAGGNLGLGGGGTVTGIAIAGGAINVGSGKFEGEALAQNVSGGGAQTALATSATASSTSQSAAAQQSDAQKTDTSDALATTDDDEKKRQKKSPVLAKYTGRVTVVLPKAQ